MPMKPSFFELTVAMCFEYFKNQKIDVGVIEVGMGGRLDSTNIIKPEVSVITNIALDHVQFLGNTVKEIAAEKAGIIKHGVPVVVGESDTKTNSVFLKKAEEMEAPIILASNKLSTSQGIISDDGKQIFNVFCGGMLRYAGLKCGQIGIYQQKNVITALAAIEQLQTNGFNISQKNIWEIIHRGRMPQLIANNDFDWQMFYGAYVRTYIERDVHDLTQVGDEGKFIRFMISAAARTGSLLNLAEIARDVGVSQPTAERWLSVLVASNIVYLLQPYFNNVIKRIVKTPKMYFLDTGLAAYLTRWNAPETLQNGAMAGAFFESWVISEIISSFYNNGILEPPLWFYRDKDMKEIDLLIEQDGTLYPIEIKKHSDPTTKDIVNFKVLEKISDKNCGTGGIICTYDTLTAINMDNKIIPIKYL